MQCANTRTRTLKHLYTPLRPISQLSLPLFPHSSRPVLICHTTSPQKKPASNPKTTNKSEPTNQSEPSTNPLLAPFVAVATSLQAGASVATEAGGGGQGSSGSGAHEHEQQQQQQQQRETAGNGAGRLAGKG